MTYIINSYRYAAAYSDDTQAWLDQLSSNAYTVPSAGQAGNIDTMVVSLNTALSVSNLSSHFDFFYIHANDGSSDAGGVNLVTPASFECTQVNSPTWTSNQGFTGNGSSSYLDTNYNLSTDSTNYLQNDACMGIWYRTLSTGTANVIGIRDGANGAAMIDTTSVIRSRLNVTLASYEEDTVATGLWQINRTGDTTNQQHYVNGSVGSSGSGVSSTVALFNYNVYILAQNNAGTAGTYSDGQIAISYAGASMTATQASDVYTAINTYMATL